MYKMALEMGISFHRGPTGEPGGPFTGNFETVEGGL